jgi:hypothetical protein
MHTRTVLPGRLEGWYCWRTWNSSRGFLDEGHYAEMKRGVLGTDLIAYPSICHTPSTLTTFGGVNPEAIFLLLELKFCMRS